MNEVTKERIQNQLEKQLKKIGEDKQIHLTKDHAFKRELPVGRCFVCDEYNFYFGLFESAKNRLKGIAEPQKTVTMKKYLLLKRQTSKLNPLFVKCWDGLWNNKKLNFNQRKELIDLVFEACVKLSSGTLQFLASSCSATDYNSLVSSLKTSLKKQVLAEEARERHKKKVKESEGTKKKRVKKGGELTDVEEPAEEEEEEYEEGEELPDEYNKDVDKNSEEE